MRDLTKLLPKFTPKEFEAFKVGMQIGATADPKDIQSMIDIYSSLYKVERKRVNAAAHGGE